MSDQEVIQGSQSGIGSSAIGSAPVAQPAMQNAQSAQNQAVRAPKRKFTEGDKKLLVAAAIVALVIIGTAIMIQVLPSSPGTTTIDYSNKIIIRSCIEIDSPGSYYVAYGIQSKIQGGACITISANNVNLVCGAKPIIGSGPYAGVPPFTYGIEINGTSNVSISGCTIRNFSYGIYAPTSNSIVINDNNVSINYMSNIFLNRTNNGMIYNNSMYGSVSQEGSLHLGKESTKNKIYNNTILRSMYYGISINASGNEFYSNYVNTTRVSFYCDGGNGLKENNTGYSNICYNSTGCSFMQCKGINIPVNLSQIRLGSQINRCGGISNPGNYVLTNNIDMRNYVNVSAAQLSLIHI